MFDDDEHNALVVVKLAAAMAAAELVLPYILGLSDVDAAVDPPVADPAAVAPL